MLAAARLDGDKLGYVVFDLDSGRRMAARNADEPFIPASVAKVPMAVAALGILGPEHRFETTLHTTGRIVGSAIKGDLYLRGGGDPYLMTEDLAALLRDLQSRGITRVDGRFFFDASELAEAEQIDPVQPDAAQYNPGLGALCLNFNRIAFAWEHDGDRVTAACDLLLRIARGQHCGRRHRLQPGSFGIDSGGRAGACSRAGRRELGLWATDREGRAHLAAAAPPCARCRPSSSALWPPRRELRCRHRNPVRFLREPRSWRRISAHRSSELVRTTLRHSNNLGAEMIGLAAARRLVGQPQSLDQASRTVTQWLTAQIPETDWKGFSLVNFSGLSSESRTSPAQLAAILAYGARQHYGFDDLYSLLPAKPWDLDEDDGKGKKGKQETGPPVELHAKTGTVAYGRGLAGFIDKGSGRRIGFVVFVTDSQARQMFDASNRVRVLVLPPEARSWLKRARNLERWLVVKWANGG